MKLVIAVDSTFNNKVVFISGSNSGLGKTTALAFLKQGAKVIINGIDESKLNHTQVELNQLGWKVEVFAGDIGNESICLQLADFIAKKFGFLDVFIANAGLSSKELFEKTKPEVFKKIIENNIYSVSTPLHALLPLLEKSKGHFVVINSIAGMVGLPTSAAYSASKMAVKALIQSIEIEKQFSHIHFGCIYFGFIQNDAHKTTYNGDGVLVEVPQRRYTLISQDEAANKIISCCKKRKKTMYVSALAKFVYVLSRWAPGLLSYLIKGNFQKFIDAQKIS